MYWTYSEWTEGFLRLLDYLKVDEVSCNALDTFFYKHCKGSEK